MAFSAALTACGIGGGGSNQQQGNSPLVDTGQSSQSGTPASTSGTGAKNSVQGVTATAGPSAGGNVKITSNQAAVGNLVLTLDVQAARRMAPEGSSSASPAPQNQQGQGDQGQKSQGQNAAAPQEIVLAGQMLHVSKNMDTNQGPPPDPKDGQGDYVRHVDIQVKDKTTGQVVPYLSVTVDLLRDGRPIQYDVALVPEVPAGGKPDQLHYGNNVAFPGKGRYQLFVRMPPSPMVGNEAPPSSQFEVDIQ